MNTQLQLKIRPDFFLLMCKIVSDATATVTASFNAGGISSDTSLVSLWEYSSKIQHQYITWQHKKPAKAYNYRLPFSVAIASVRILHVKARSKEETILYNTLLVRLYDSGVDINSYLK